MPHLDQLIGSKYRLRVAGRDGASRLCDLVKPRVQLLGRVEDLTQHYRQARVFIAPLRFAAGMPHKLHEAAACGLPAVATSLLAKQLGWEDGTELLVADTPEAFARQCARLYTDPALWQRLREAALVRVTADCDPAGFRENLTAILHSVGVATAESIVTRQQPLREHDGTPSDNRSENGAGVSKRVSRPKRRRIPHSRRNRQRQANLAIGLI
jgi:hypothetical protein